MHIDSNDVCALVTATTEPVVRQRHIERWREAPAEPPPPPLMPPPSPPAVMVAPLARSLATAAAATSPASSESLISAKSVRLLSLLLTPSHRRCRRPRQTHGTPFWWRRRRCPRPPSRLRRELVGDKQDANGRRREWQGGE